MSKSLKLEILNSCHQDWHTMLPESKGRYCLSCQKKVVDFTHMSDTELTRFFQQAKEPTCGRFSDHQLNRNLAVPKKPQHWLKYFLQATLPAFLLSLKASATNTYRIENTTYQSPLLKVPKDTTNLPETITVEGSLQDEQGNLIPYATIMLKGTNKGVLTDSTGNFVFRGIQAPATLIFSSVGYTSQEVVVQPGQPRLLLKMQLSAVLMGEVVTVGYVAVSRSKRKARKAQAIQKEEPQVRLFPNPLLPGKSINLQCQKLDDGSYVLELFNASGTPVFTEKVAYTKEMRQIQVQPPYLIAGNYFLKLTHEKKGKAYTQQVVIIQ